MKKTFLHILSLMLLCSAVRSQETIYPAAKQTTPVVITNATVHTGTGQVLNNTSIEIKDGKITNIGSNITSAGAKTIDASGKHVYPGFILSITDLGLIEIPSVRAGNDLTEIGDLNPSIRSIVAYNTDSKVITAIRPVGILLANVVPQGGIISGSSSVVQLDAWNWEDAAYKMDNAINFYMPSLMPRPGRFAAFAAAQGQADPVKEGLEQIDKIKRFFREAKAYNTESAHEETNIKLAAVKGLFDGSQKLFIHAKSVKQMLLAIDFVKEFGFKVVIVGGDDSWQIADLLKQNNIAVVLTQPHTLPTLQDDDIEQPYKTPALLQKAGVLFAITDVDGETRGRNLAFNAGTAAAYGLTKEQALSSITLNAAKILGIDDKTGSIEVGKDANLFISTGDALDMRTNIITDAFIQGRQINLDNKQKQLYERYKYKYNLK